MTVREKKQQVEQAIATACQAVGRDHQVTLVAVTKYLDLSQTQEVIDAGLHHLGENRVDKFLAKYHHFQQEGLVWHFIGSLQRRKVKEVINQIDYFHGLDSLPLAHEIQKRAKQPVKCFIQVNVSGEASKHGFAPEELDEAVSAMAELDKLEVVGLMTMAPMGSSEEDLHALFAQTRQLKERLREKQLKTMPLTELSMGMSGDFTIAIQEGATFVRIGSAFFD